VPLSPPASQALPIDTDMTYDAAVSRATIDM